MSESYVKFGALLKLERERRGSKLEVVSSDLKIPIETLQHLEAGQQDALPSELYFRLFAKSYAEYLGIDFTKTIEAIREELGENVEPQTPEQAAEAGHKTEAGHKPEPGRKTKPEPAEPVAAEVEERSSGKIALIVSLSLAVVVALSVGVYFLFFSTEKEPEATLPAQPVQPDYTATRGDFDWDTTSNLRDSMLLTLTARIGSWATVLADGDTMVYQMLTPGRPYNVTAREQLLVTIGNPLVVDVALNGQPATLADPDNGEVSQVEINRSSVDLFLMPTDTVDTPGIQAPADTSTVPPPGRSQSETGRTGGR